MLEVQSMPPASASREAPIEEILAPYHCSERDAYLAAALAFPELTRLLERRTRRACAETAKFLFASHRANEISLDELERLCTEAL